MPTPLAPAGDLSIIQAPTTSMRLAEIRRGSMLPVTRWTTTSNAWMNIRLVKERFRTRKGSPSRSSDALKFFLLAHGVGRDVTLQRFGPFEEGEAGLFRSERAILLQRGMSDMDDSPAPCPPVGKYCLCIGLKVRVVPLPPVGIIET